MPKSEVRNLYMDVPDRHVIRTQDVYQTQTEIGVHQYSDTLLHVVANYQNSGIPEGCNAEGMAGKSKHGEIACQIYAVINPKTRTIDHIGFRSRGCLSITACASQICVMAHGLTIQRALTITPDDIKQSLDGVPYDKEDTPVFAVEALHAAIGDFLLSEGGLELQQKEAPCDVGGMNCLLCEHCSLRNLRMDWIVEHREDADKVKSSTTAKNATEKSEK